MPQKLFIARSRGVVFAAVHQRFLFTQWTQLYLQTVSGYSTVGDVGTVLIWFVTQVTYVLTHSLTNSMQHIPSWEAKRYSACQIPRIYGTRRFITAFASARHMFLSWARSIHSMTLTPLPDLLTYLLTHSTQHSPSWEAKQYSACQIPRIYGTRRFITAFTSARYFSLSWAKSIHSMTHIPLPVDPS
jgi:hypothetical protein